MEDTLVRRSMMKGTPFTGMAAALVFVVACSSSTAPRVPTGAIQIVPGGSVTWTRTSSTTRGFSVPITVTNNWDRTIYFLRGCGVNVEQNTQGSWRKLPNETVCTLAAYPPTPIAPGESLTQAAVFYTTESSALPGQYRVIVGLAVKDDDEFRLLTDDVSASAPFLVTAGS